MVRWRLSIPAESAISWVVACNLSWAKEICLAVSLTDCSVPVSIADIYWTNLSHFMESKKYFCWVVALSYKRKMSVWFCNTKVFTTVFFEFNYFVDLIKKETGKSAQEYIQRKLIDIAKERVFDINNSISENSLWLRI